MKKNQMSVVSMSRYTIGAYHRFFLKNLGKQNSDTNELKSQKGKGQ